MTGAEDDWTSWFVGGTECYRRSLELIGRALATPETLEASVLVGAAQAYATLALTHSTVEQTAAIQEAKR